MRLAIVMVGLLLIRMATEQRAVWYEPQVSTWLWCVFADRTLLDLSPSVFVVPENLRDDTIRLLDTAGQLNGQDFPYCVKVVKVGTYVLSLTATSNSFLS